MGGGGGDGTELAAEHTFVCGKGNDNPELGTGFFWWTKNHTSI
jgi:hypothetical protein